LAQGATYTQQFWCLYGNLYVPWIEEQFQERVNSLLWDDYQHATLLWMASDMPCVTLAPSGLWFFLS
jgi:hypothetical protein